MYTFFILPKSKAPSPFYGGLSKWDKAVCQAYALEESSEKIIILQFLKIHKKPGKEITGIFRDFVWVVLQPTLAINKAQPLLENSDRRWASSPRRAVHPVGVFCFFCSIPGRSWRVAECRSPAAALKECAVNWRAAGSPYSMSLESRALAVVPQSKEEVVVPLHCRGGLLPLHRVREGLHAALLITHKNYINFNLFSNSISFKPYKKLTQRLPRNYLKIIKKCESIAWSMLWFCFKKEQCNCLFSFLPSLCWWSHKEG